MAFGHVNVVPPIDSDDVIGREQIGQPGGVAGLDETGKLRESQIPTNVTEHIQNKSNPHGVTPYQIGAASNPNLLDNWYFANPINQRGQTKYTVTGYTIDRWKSLNDLNVTLSANGMNLKYEGGGYFVQVLEQTLKDFLTGKTCTLSALMSDGTLWSDTAVFGVESFFVEIPSDSGLLLLYNNPEDTGVSFRCGNDSQIITAVKFEIGSQQTLAHQEDGVWVLNEIPKYAEQMLICSQYDANDNYIGHARITSGTADLVAGSSSLTNGDIYLVYE